MTTMGTEDGQGMTRDQSVEYLKWVLGELGLATSWSEEILEFLDASRKVNQQTVPIPIAIAMTRGFLGPLT